MPELYLIAHKVRGEAAFDVAEQMACPECLRTGEVLDGLECAECDGLGYWWIIPTSGHRAYPYWSFEMTELLFDARLSPHDYVAVNLLSSISPMPPATPDHYLHGPAPKVDIRALFKKSDYVPNPEAFIKRRL